MKIENGVLQSVVSADIPESGVFEIPEGVTSVGSSAFWGCSSLKEIHLPESITSIGSSAFRGCKSLKEINIPKSVTSIGARAFEGCISLKEIYIPESVTLIESDTFWECRSLKEIHIPEGITTIKYSAFCGCKSMKEIHLPESITSIESGAFWGCESLKSIKWGTAYYAVRCIDGYCIESGEEPTSIAVLYRTNQQSEDIAALLMAQNIPFVSTEKIPSRYQHWMFEDIKSYQKLAKGEKWSKQDLARVLNHPQRFLSNYAYVNAGLDEKRMTSAAFKLIPAGWKRDNAIMTIHKFFNALKMMKGKSPRACLKNI